MLPDASISVRIMMSVCLLLMTWPVSGEEHYKRAAFTNLTWQEGMPVVEIEGQWYRVSAINEIPVDSLVRICKKVYPLSWPEDFGLKLTKLLKIAGVPVIDEIRFSGSLLSDPGKAVQLDPVPLTTQNWQALQLSLAVYNKRVRRDHTDAVAEKHHFIRERILSRREVDSIGLELTWESDWDKYEYYRKETVRKNKLPLWLEPREIQEDLDQLEWILEHHYSYLGYHIFDYRTALDVIRSGAGEGMSAMDFSLQVQRVLGMFGDGHTRVRFHKRWYGYDKKEQYWPFYITAYKDRFLVYEGERKHLLDPEHPFLKGGNGQETEEFMRIPMGLQSGGNIALTRRKWASWTNKLEFLEQAFALSGKELILELESADGKSSVSRSITLLDDEPDSDREKRPSELMTGNIGYLRIDKMRTRSSYLEALTDWMLAFKDTRGLIIDLRDNAGGSRIILHRLFPFFVDPEDGPRVISVAAYRLDPATAPIAKNGYLKDRELFPLSSSIWIAEEKDAIRQFAKTFVPEWKLPKDKFSEWHYSVISPKASHPKYYYYDKPVILLMDQQCYSATEVFLAAFKGMKNVTLLGETTTGGSGRAKVFELFHSRIQMRMCTMASFRPDGKIFEGKGVTPDIHFPDSLNDHLGITDDMKARAVQLILSR